MVDFSKKLKKTNKSKKINPLEIYQDLDRKSITGQLRPAQERILENWFQNKKNTKDLIIKLHTGVGKTLIGLLILQSKLNANEGPCLYICPNIYLVNQVRKEADKFGIHYCVIEDSNQLPNPFLKGEKILITHVQKVFNGKTIFGINNNYTSVGSVVLDDSHACIEAIDNSFTIQINREKNKKTYNKILSLFEEDLIEQGEGTFLDIINGEYGDILPIPYWAWENKKSEILKILSDVSTENGIKYVWPLLKNNINKCRALIDCKNIEIVPYHIPMDIFGTFYYAKNRILMSATTQNDTFFVKGLDFQIEAIKNPLMDKTLKWSGEKMILLPSLIHEDFDRDKIISVFAKDRTKKNTNGIVSLVPSFNKSNIYKTYGSDVANSKDIFEKIFQLKNDKDRSKTLVVVNRYDGIDLPDDACRILIIDSLPFFDSLNDRYKEECRHSSDIVNIKIAQKIEQGIGRSVRGEKDFSVIMLIGSDLIKFVNSIKSNKYFSDQTLNQIKIANTIAEMAKEDLDDDEKPMKVIIDLINQILKRDEGWKSFYVEEMNEMVISNNSKNVFDIVYSEKQADAAFYNSDYETACKEMQKIVDAIDDDNEKAWYLQELARCKFYISKIDSNKLQQNAFKKNKQLLKPLEGITYKKLEYINENRISSIKKWVGQFNTYEEFQLQVRSILDELTFGKPAEKFENALQCVGKLLGFLSQRPDKIIRKGPDNLWGISQNLFIMFECKSEVDVNRKAIEKYEASQMNSHCGWFESEYGGVDVTRILVIPTKKLSYSADFTHNVKIMRKSKLRFLKSNIKNFCKEFKKYEINELSDEKLNQFLIANNLSLENIKNDYCEEYYHLKNREK